MSSACGSGPPGSHPSRILAPASLGLRFEEIKIEGEKHRALQSLWSHDSCLDRGEVHLGQAGSALFPGAGSFHPPHLGHGSLVAEEVAEWSQVSSPPLHGMRARGWPCLRAARMAAWPWSCPMASAVRLDQLPPGRACGPGGSPASECFHVARGPQASIAGPASSGRNETLGVLPRV